VSFRHGNRRQRASKRTEIPEAVLLPGTPCCCPPYGISFQRAGIKPCKSWAVDDTLFQLALRLAVAQIRLWQVGKLMPAKLAGHMEEHGCLPVLYLSAWLLTAYASAFPLTFAARVVDVMLTDSYAEPMMKARARAGGAVSCARPAASKQPCQRRSASEGRWPHVGVTLSSDILSMSATLLVVKLLAHAAAVSCSAGRPARQDWCPQVALGIIRAAEKHLLAMDDMEEMVEFMKNEVPNWDVQTLQVRALATNLYLPCLAVKPGRHMESTAFARAREIMGTG
jgi:hypothetical protein